MAMGGLFGPEANEPLLSSRPGQGDALTRAIARAL
jgi:hypothetical protein